MNKKLLTGLIGGLMFLSAGSALAQMYPPPPGPQGDRMMEARRSPYRIQDRIDRQERDIRQGMRSGVLTRGEARILRDNLAFIKRDFRHAMRKGYVSFEERARLDDMLNRNHRMIRRMENNGITRF